MSKNALSNLERGQVIVTPLLALALTVPALAQQAAPQPTPAPKPDETVELSPFVVTQEKDQGYFAENTLAGSRIKANVGDLAASISIVTKQQMDDTASLDINDIFRYESSTEGSGSYTPMVTDRGTAKDTVSGYTLGNDGATTTNANSNRIRGLGAPEASINYYSTNSRVPFDSYNTQSVEISRGPNSMLFGLGSPAGIVNQTTAQANLNANSNSVQLRTDDNGSARASFSFNRSLIKGKLAIYGAALYNDQQFERKPSYDITRRQYGAITFRPFRKTTIRAFAENFNNDQNRPNFLTPRDFVTPWYESGRPAYNALNRSIIIQDTGAVLGPYTFNTNSPGKISNAYTGTGWLTNENSPLYTQGIAFDNGARPVLRIDDGQQVDYFQRSLAYYRPRWASPAVALPTGASLGWTANDPRYAIADRQWTGSTNRKIPTATLNGQAATYQSWQFAGITDKSIYDWTEYNTNQSNFSKTRARHYNIDLEQEIFSDLFLGAGFFRQKVDAVDNMTVSQLTGATVQIDTNMYLPDGSPNEYFGLPYLTDSAPDTFKNLEYSDNYRVMLTYNLDFQKKGGWRKWLGRHQLFAMWSGQDLKRSIERWRIGFDSGDADGTLRFIPNNLLNDGFNLWNQTITRQYYLASPGDPEGRVSHSLGNFGNKGWDQPYSTNVTVFDQQTGQTREVSMVLANHFSDAGSFNFKRNLESYNFNTQSFLLNNRLVATLGYRKDDLTLQKTSGGIYVNDDGVSVPALTAQQINDARTGLVNHDLIMGRWTPKQHYKYDTKTLGFAFKPLSNWESIDSAARSGNVLAKFASGLTFYYNTSDNWNPPTSVVTDYFRQALPTPTGEGREIGVGIAMFDNKLVARVNWFETENHDERTTAAGTLLTRLAYGDTTLLQPWAETIVRLRNGANPMLNKEWNTNDVVDVRSGALQQQVWDLMKLPVNYYAGLAPGASQESKAKGTELNLTFNPNKNWTMKLTGSKTDTSYTSVAPQYDTWLAARKPVWDAAAVDIPDFTDINGTEYSLKNFWASYGYSSAAKLSNTDGNTNAQNYFNNTVVSQVALAKALQGATSPNQSRYRASYLTNYTFTEGRLKGWSTTGSVRWQSRAAVGYYGYAADPTRPTVINAVDPTRPVYVDNGEYFFDIGVAYARKIMSNKVAFKVQLNVDNVFEDGGLKPIAVNFDGSPWAYRIVDPRRFILTTTFNF